MTDGVKDENFGFDTIGSGVLAGGAGGQLPP